jgi:hypothetical protein
MKEATVLRGSWFTSKSVFDLPSEQAIGVILFQQLRWISVADFSWKAQGFPMLRVATQQSLGPSAI